MKHCILPLIALLSVACSCSHDRARSTSAEEKQQEAAAVRLARQEALALTQGASTDSIAIQTALIEVRIREASIRAEGREDLADTYINTFIATLDSVNPSLSRQLGVN